MAITQETFIGRMVERGLSYEMAHEAYAAFMETVADGIINGEKINLGKVCSIMPVRKAPRTYKMGFERTTEGVHKVKREYHKGTTISWKLNIFKSFVNTHGLNWVGPRLNPQN